MDTIILTDRYEMHKGGLAVRKDVTKLVAKAKQGSEKAFAQLYGQIYQEMYYYALSALGNEDDAADAVSDAVLDAYQQIAGLREDEAFRCWFYRILTVKIKRKQKEYVQRREQIAVLGEQAQENAFITQANFSGAELDEALELLSENERTAVTLNVICGYTSEEVSEMTGMNPATVRSHIKRGREKLRARLNPADLEKPEKGRLG